MPPTGPVLNEINELTGRNFTPKQALREFKKYARKLKCSTAKKH